MTAARGLLAAMAGFLVDPLDADPLEPARALPRETRGVVAVVGLTPRCGTTTVARALGAELALRDEGAAAVVTAAMVGSGGVPLGTPAAGRLTRAMARTLIEDTRAVGRLCLATCAPGAEMALVDAARDVAPLVIDVAEPAQASVVASLADAVVLVGVPATEPALAPVVGGSFARVGPEPVVVLNRDRGDCEPWRGRHAVALPESRLGAQLALAGREPRSALGRAISDLADAVTPR